MLFKRVNSPTDLKKLKIEDLKSYASELRSYLVDVIQKNGGHFAANLGVVELTVALHYVFDTPEDIVVWDVGHQTYAHKVITGRRDVMANLRKKGGPSGFTKISESQFDSFGAGHAATALSAASGFAAAAKLNGKKNLVIAVVGDGALSSGLAFEGLNNIGHLKQSQVLVVFNDNNMSISGSSGWATEEEAQKKEFFESLGLNYNGAIDGHDIQALTSAFSAWKSKALNGEVETPQVIHIKTVKGKGYEAAEANPEKHHSTAPESIGAKSKASTYTEIFAKALCELAQENKKILAITAAMADGTGLSDFKRLFPERFFDVGIAEEHAVVFAAALAKQGLTPVVAIYSTFMQRAFDQLIHDVALQNLPVVFCLDRAGLVGSDGPTHHGNFDFSYTRLIPGMTVMAPANQEDLKKMLKLATELKGPSVMRFPKAKVSVLPDGGVSPLREETMELGEAQTLRKWPEDLAKYINKILFWCAGSMVYPALEAADILTKKGFACAVVNSRFIKPLDKDLLSRLVNESKNQDGTLIVTLEENTIKGGLGEEVLFVLNELNLKIKVMNLGIADEFIEHGTREELLNSVGLDTEGIVRAIEEGTR